MSDWAASSAQGRQRLHNEDSWGQLGPIFVVSDGMGGLSNGAEASAAAVAAMTREWFDRELAAAEAVVRQVNAEVCIDLTGDERQGCTMTAIRVAHDQAMIVHVGDSRAYRIRDRRAELLTHDHNLRSELLAAGIVPGSTRAFGPLRALTSYLGRPDDELQIDLRSVSLRDGDRLVLCTDGVLDGQTHSEFVGRAGVGSTAEAVRRLTALGGADDATAIAIDIGVDRD